MLWLFSSLCGEHMSGALSALYTIGFEAASKIFINQSDDFPINGNSWLQALEAAILAIQK